MPNTALTERWEPDAALAPTGQDAVTTTTLSNEQELIMTTTLHHAIKIDASPSDVFKALADAGEMAAWHVGAIESEIAVGSTVYLNPKPGLKYGWKAD
jgi:hypothetical protein